MNSIILEINIRWLLCQDPDLIPQESTLLSFVRNEKTVGLMFKESSAFTIQRLKTSRRISTETLGKLPPGETDLEKLVTLEPRRRKGSLQAAKIAAPAQEVIDPRDPGRIILPIGYCLLRHSSCCDARQNFLHGNCRVLASMPTLAEQELPQLSWWGNISRYR